MKGSEIVNSANTVVTAETIISDIFDIKNMAVISSHADSDSILSNWFRMLTLALNDPDGCVRSNPTLPMNAQSFANYFHCPLDSVIKTIEILQKLNMITVTNGLIKVNACRQASSESFAGCDKYEDDDCEEVLEEEINNELYTESDASPANNRYGMIPFESLPPACQRILNCWNTLPLIKMTGLYPALLKKLNDRIEKYGEEEIINAVYLVSRSPFLLGKAENSTGWFITFKWMLEEFHLEYIMEGRYLDRKDPLRAKLRKKRNNS